ncbi:MAG: RluA family pseudouridine synthase [Candidatus Kerfeldbacteria bacterium]|nr:RluA family pseudouridine synthase [Candidatus Kerfeldbacteria bacterium]
MPKKISPKEFVVIVDQAHNDWRLDQFLTEQMTGVSRSQIQRLIVGKRVRVNDKAVSKHHFLRTGDHVVVMQDDVSDAPQEKPAVIIPTISILFEDDALIVLDKPVGVLVHAAAHSSDSTVVDFLLNHCSQIASVGDDAARPGIVHRLDRPVSGVLIVAKTAEAFTALKKQFSERTVEKEYRAIVHGKPSREVDTIRFVIARSRTRSGKMAARPEHEEGKDAWTEYELIQSTPPYSELLVRIKTGRTHQIRAHLAAINCPVVGDPLYTSKQYRSGKYPRLFLHAHRLSITHPLTHKKMTFVSPIPAVFPEFLQRA